MRLVHYRSASELDTEYIQHLLTNPRNEGKYMTGFTFHLLVHDRPAVIVSHRRNSIPKNRVHQIPILGSEIPINLTLAILGRRYCGLAGWRVAQV
jgi:hypothetical protein